MKEKINKEAEDAVVAAGIMPVVITRKRKTSIVNHIPTHTPPSFKINPKLEEEYTSFITSLSDYEHNTPPNLRDPYIQWIINNKRFVIKDSFTKLSSKILDLNKKLGLLNSPEIQAQEKDLKTQLDKLEEDVKSQNGLIAKRLHELSALKDKTSCLSQLSAKINQEEKLILELHNLLDPIDIDEYNNNSNKEVLEYLRKIKPLVKMPNAANQRAKMTYKDAFASFKELHPDDKNFILLSVNECIKLIDTAQIQLKQNSSKIMLEEDRFRDKSKLLSETIEALNKLYDTISLILRHSLNLKTEATSTSSLGALNAQLETAQKDYFHTIDAFAKQIQNYTFSSQANDHIRYSAEISKIQGALLKKIMLIKEEYLPALKLESEENNVLQSIATSIDVAFKKTFHFDSVIEIDFKHKKSHEQQLSELIQALTNIKVTTYHHPKKEIYLKLIDAIKQAQDSCIPFQERNESYITLNKQLIQLRTEVSERLDELYKHPSYKAQCLHDDIKVLDLNLKVVDKLFIASNEKNLKAFIGSKDIIHYADVELMEMDFNNFNHQKQTLLDALNEKIRAKNWRFTDNLEQELNAKTAPLQHLEEDYRPYQLLYNYYLTQLHQLKRPRSNADYTTFYEAEIATFEKLKALKIALFGERNNYEKYNNLLESNCSLDLKKQRQWYTLNELLLLIDDMTNDPSEHLLGLNAVLVQTKQATETLKRSIQNTLRRLRQQSQESLYIANFIQAINQLENKPVLVTALLEELAQHHDAYLDNPGINKENFHTAIMQLITNLINNEDFVKMVSEAPTTHYTRLVLQFINDILEFFAKLFAIKEPNKPQFFAEVPKKIQQCDIVLNAQKARAKLLELEQSLATYKPPVLTC